MIKIAHRGNFDGPKEIENKPIDLVVAISKGFDVEVDIRMNNSGIFLGHDTFQHEIDEDFIKDIKEHAWFHCKNIEALGYFTNVMPEARFFWHENDDYTLTSNGYIWAYPGKRFTNKSIVVVKEKTDLKAFEGAYGVCSDYLI